MHTASRDINPFANAKTLEEREAVWKYLREIAKPVSKEEGERLMQEAIRLQKEDLNK